MALGWQAKPMFEHTDASPAVASRAHLTHSSVHRAQFGGPCCTEKSAGVGLREGIASSAAMAASVAIVIDATIRKNRSRR